MKFRKRLFLFPVISAILCACLSLGIAAESGEDAAKTGLSTMTIVSLAVGAVLIIGLAVLCVIKREKVAEGLRAYRSEMKKITWYPWKSVWRSTLLVIVIVLATAVVVGLLDYAFFQIQYLITGQGVRLFG